MGWSISFRINTGKSMADVIDFGMTYNVSGMYYKALGADGLDGLHLKKACDAAPILSKAIADMKENSADYMLMNPANGWGNYDSALDLLCQMLQACQDHPLTEINIT